jgi:hypothetical protein
VFERPLRAGANGVTLIWIPAARVPTLRAQRSAVAFPRFPANKMIDPLSFADSLSFRLKTGSDGSWEASFFST